MLGTESPWLKHLHPPYIYTFLNCSPSSQIPKSVFSSRKSCLSPYNRIGFYETDNKLELKHKTFLVYSGKVVCCSATFMAL